MVNVTELKNGVTFLLDGSPFKVIKYTHTKIGRGGANVKLSLRNLENGRQVEKTFPSTKKLTEIVTQKRPLQYLYNDGSLASFMDLSSFEQIEIEMGIIGDDAKYIKEGENVDVLFWDKKALSVEIPPKVNLKVTETAPGAKGNSAANVTKSASLENGMEVKVPLFIKNGDTVRVDTRIGEYVERVS